MEPTLHRKTERVCEIMWSGRVVGTITVEPNFEVTLDEIQKWPDRIARLEAHVGKLQDDLNVSEVAVQELRDQLDDYESAVANAIEYLNDLK